MRVWRIFQPCFLAVAMTERRQAKVRAPARVRKPPEIFILTFIILRSLGLVVGERDGEIIEEAQHVGFELVQPDQEIMSRAMGRPSAGSDRSGEGRQVSVE